jgi:DNA-binding MarR family transcriptional regulator
MAFDSLTTLVLSLFRAHQVIVADGDQLASQWRLSSAKWKTLGAIALAGRPITGPEIGRSMGLSRQGAQKQLDALMRERLVSRAVNEADARAPLYTLTSKGLGTYEQVTAKWRARSKQLLRELDVGELLGAAKALDDVVTAIATNPQPPIRRKG